MSKDTSHLKTIDGEKVEIGSVFFLKDEPGHKIDTSTVPCDHHDGWTLYNDSGLWRLAPTSADGIVYIMSYPVDRLYSSQMKAIEDARSKWLEKEFKAKEQVKRYNHMLIQLRYDKEAKDDYFNE